MVFVFVFVGKIGYLIVLHIPFFMFIIFHSRLHLLPSYIPLEPTYEGNKSSR